MAYIPAFPHFVTLDLSHAELLRSVSKRFPPYSDYNFISLYSWDTDETIGISSLHDNLIVRFSDYHSGEIFLSLLGTNELHQTLQALFEYCSLKKLDRRLQLVPHSVVEAISHETQGQYDIAEDRDNHDYIVSTKNVCEGQIGRRKRAVARHFQETFGHISKTLPLDLQDDQTLKSIHQLNSLWVVSRGSKESDIKESSAIGRSLSSAKELGLRGVGSYLDGRLMGYILFDTLEGQTAILHFGKADRGYRGLFDNLKIETAKQLFSEGVEYMNFEQDLGVEGLRADKEAYHPVNFLKKYTVSQKT